MNNISARCLVSAMACNARIEAMKAENSRFTIFGETPAYREDSFNAEAAELDRLAREIGDWSHVP